MLWLKTSSWENEGIRLFWCKASWVHNHDHKLNSAWRQFYKLDPSYSDYFRNITWSISASLVVTFFTKIESWSVSQLTILFLSILSFTHSAFHLTIIANFIKKQQTRFNDLKLIARGQNNFKEVSEEIDHDIVQGHVDIRKLKRSNRIEEYPNFLEFREYMENICANDNVKKKLYPLRLQYTKFYFLLGILLLAAACILGRSNSFFKTNSEIFQITSNIIFSSTLYLLVAISFVYIFDVTKFFHLAHALVITSGGYIFWEMSNVISIPIMASLIISIFSSVVIGLLCEFCVYRPLRKKSTGSLSLLVASLGVYIIGQNAIVLLFGNETQVVHLAFLESTYNLFGVYISLVQLISIGVSVFFFCMLLLVSTKTIIGKSIRAISTNEELGNIYGISSNRVILIVFVLSSAIAGFAGILSGIDTGLSPGFGFNLLLYGVVVMIVGGVGRIEGMIFSSLLVASAQHLTAFYIDTKWMDTIVYLLLIVFLIVTPKGFTGNAIRKIQI